MWTDTRLNQPASRPLITSFAVAAGVFCAALTTMSPPSSVQAGAPQTGQIRFFVADADGNQPLAARMHLQDERGEPVIPPAVPSWRDHFSFDGQVALNLPAGGYRYEVERGPEYRLIRGEFALRAGDRLKRELRLTRIADLKREGWWSGELHIHRPLQDVELLMRAEDLHVGPVITWWNNRNPWKDRQIPDRRLVRFDGDRYYHLMAGEDERGGGALLYFNLKKPLPITDSQREYPSAATFLKQARQHRGVHVDIEKPFWWDMPIWVAAGGVDSIGLANNHMLRDGVLGNEAWGKPRDLREYPGARGNGQWTRDLYYRLLESGIRLPPSAGSASGVLTNPVGYNRVYAYCGDDFSYEKWFRALRAGRVVVTNGPLLRVRVNGELPGHLFRTTAGKTIALQPQVKLHSRDETPFVEVVQNGRVVSRTSPAELAERGGKLPPVRFMESGWFLIRAEASTPHTYRFASTGPYYVEIGKRQRISRQSAQFFLDWVDERTQRVSAAIDDAGQLEEALQPLGQARAFWGKLVQTATVD